MIEFDRPWSYEEPCMGSMDWSDVQPYDVLPADLDKRCRAMLDILDNPKANIRYSHNQAILLSNKFLRANRQDLAKIIQEALI